MILRNTRAGRTRGIRILSSGTESRRFRRWNRWHVPACRPPQRGLARSFSCRSGGRHPPRVSRLTPSLPNPSPSSLRMAAKLLAQQNSFASSLPSSYSPAIFVVDLDPPRPGLCPVQSISTCTRGDIRWSPHLPRARRQYELPRRGPATPDGRSGC